MAVVRLRVALAAGPTLLLLGVWMRERGERRERGSREKRAKLEGAPFSRAAYAGEREKRESSRREREERV